MQVNNLPAIVLTFVLAGLLIGLGTVLYQNLGDASMDQMTATNVNISMATGGDCVLTTCVGTRNNITSWGGCDNRTHHYPITQAAKWNNGSGGKYNWTDDGKVYTNGTQKWLRCNFSYDAAGTPYTAFEKVQNDVLAPVATNWMGLIIMIVALSIVLVIVLRSFNVRR
jgi:hypothetical protein